MFTIKFIKLGGRGHRSFCCSEYETSLDDITIEVRMVMSDGEEVTENVGPDSDYSVAYVTNEAGRTIDKVIV